MQPSNVDCNEPKKKPRDAAHHATAVLFDVAEEAEYLATKAGAETALHWQKSLNDTVANLLSHPHLGRPRTDLQPPGIRSWRVEKFRRWLIFYAVREDALVLLRVRYGMMDLPSLEFER